ncbi:MAG: DinB family protein [Candidatus Rokubacteria bacterium]|nr:DinB family protein [Candidatus Rokubacteria bacterium]
MTTRETAAAALARFDHAWGELDKTVSGLSERELVDIRDPAGWAAKDHLMHVAVWEQALLARLDGRPRYHALGLDASTEGSEDWDALNAKIFAATRQRPAGEVLDSLRGTHTATRACLAALAAGTADAPTAESFVADVGGYADHYDQHRDWIRELVGR